MSRSVLFLVILHTGNQQKVIAASEHEKDAAEVWEREGWKLNIGETLALVKAKIETLAVTL